MEGAGVVVVRYMVGSIVLKGLTFELIERSLYRE